jgi:hypothetical protein
MAGFVLTVNGALEMNRQQSASERRGRHDGRAAHDWLKAEREIQAIADSHDYDEDIRAMAKGKDAEPICEALSQRDVQSSVAVVDAGARCVGCGPAR